MLTVGEPLPVNKSPTALPDKDKPMMATVGPITTGGIILLIHLVPANLTIKAKIT